ncbi:hypothetical protein [Actinomyces bowdenii]|uniref:Uncharacterized protein n=1 Tax=Actinomyces bowdenii TaxID=131109 RepID=A0A3P1UVE7_9ACTO|nr:hypothetical protein [Actinomyces bowdenii]RRD25628.1 hypothetical protein EII10_10535 [Actinomyces bowdenii]
MSTDQTGVNDLTQDDAAEGSQGRAPRSSRRAIRQAERAAEREAILTGQQPLLTRREMRRLREEAKALKAAVEAGEITPEQARALQDPTAKQPDVPATREARPRSAGQDSSQQAATPSSVPAVGSAAQDSAAFDDTVQAPRVEEFGESSGDLSGQSWSAAGSAASPLQGQSPAAAAGMVPSPAAPEAHGPHGPAVYGGGAGAEPGPDAEPAPAAGTAPEAGPGAEADAAQAPQAKSDEAGPSWRSLTADEAVAISELPTGLMDAVDLPIISAEVERAAAEQMSTSAQPAPVPTRSSLRERLETGQVPSVAGLGPIDGASADGSQDGPGSGAAGAGEAAPAGWGAPPARPEDLAPAGAPGAAAPQESPSWAVDQRADEAAVRAADAVPVQDAPAAQPQAVEAQGAPGHEGGEAPVAASPSSVRRPIVRIPAAAQGVRTVNISTGELSAVQPVGSAESAAPGQEAQYGQPGESVDGLGEVTADAQETTVQDAIAVGEAVDGEEGSAAPQWKSLRERMTSEGSLVGGQQPVSPYSTTGMEQTTSVEYAPLSDAGLPETGAAGPAGPAWDQQMPSAAASAQQAQAGLPEEEPERSSGAGKVLLILLVVLVVALVVLAIVWYLMSGGSSSAAAQVQGAAAQGLEPWISQVI